MRRTKESAWESSNQILDASAHVCVECGVAGATLANIANAGCFTRGAMYWHFENKGALFDSMVDHVMLQAEALFAAIADAREPAP